MSPALKIQRSAIATKSFAWLWRAVVLLFLASAIGRAQTVSEAELKAAFLYNFAKFVQWPTNAFSSTNTPIQLAVLGDEEFTAKLKPLLADKKAHGRSFEVRKISSPQEARNSQIVFIPSAEAKRIPQVLEVTRKLPVLTVGEVDQFLDLGGMINLLFEDAQLRFEINPEAAEKVKLEISSKLLRLAKKRSSP